MDQRLSTIGGKRPHRLTKEDLPSLARALVAVIRKQARLDKLAVRNVLCIRITGLGLDVLVRSEDWAKIIPFLSDGTFDPLVFPVSPVRVSGQADRHDASIADLDDPDLYNRIIRVLDPFFPDHFPQ